MLSSQFAKFSSTATNLLKCKDQVVFITGTGSGIGQAIAKSFGAAGAKVACSSLHEEKAIKTVEDIKKNGGEAFSMGVDVTDGESIQKGVQKVIEKYGRIDTCVSNAGIQHIEHVEKLSYEMWRKVLNIHLDAAFLVTKYVLPEMYKNNHGRMLYIGSTHSHCASVLKAPYVAAKHGMLGLARVVAKEAAVHNVSANVICPGFVWTPLVEKQIPEQSKRLGITEKEVIEKVMLKDTFDFKFSTLDDVANVTKFLSEFETCAISGQSYIISHGWNMH